MEDTVIRAAETMVIRAAETMVIEATAIKVNTNVEAMTIIVKAMTNRDPMPEFC